MRSEKNPRVVIIGAGPCGIGAGWYLCKKGYDNWIICEKNDYPGGLSASFKDERGFIWDIGGHVFFSHYEEYSRFLKEVLEGNYLTHKRDSWIRVFDTWVPYPFQSNIHYLPKEKFEECRKGLRERSKDFEVDNFREWIVTHFGRGVSECFMIPMNKKMWSYPLEKISTKWVDKRISPVDREAVKGYTSDDKISNDWGPNARFIYPLYGGTGEVFKKATGRFRDNVSLSHEVFKIDLDSRKIFFKNGNEDNYDTLINSANLRNLINAIYPKNPQIAGISKRLRSNKLLIIGVGLKRKNNDKRTWMYFSEGKYPFFRVTNLSNYSPYNVPNGDIQKYSSLLIEVSFSEGASINRDLLIEKTIEGLIDGGLLLESDKGLIESIFTLEVENGYPIPTLDRDNILAEINDFLKSQGIFSIGRFGSFSYEKGNMDDCFMQGFDIAKKIIG